MTRRALHPASDEWPAALDELMTCKRPERLYIEGRPIPAKEKCIAIVGTRRPTVVGRALARTFARALGEAGFCIVSGLALGIDSQAHQGALDASAQTVAVLGCGLTIDYPKENRSLRMKIRATGTLVTEHPDDVEPQPFHFPERNRIIAGLSTGVVVIEGGERSGASITARIALDEERHVFAVPGSVRNPFSVCPNSLIRTHQASLVTDPQHIFDEIAPRVVWDGTRVIGGDRPSMSDLELAILRAIDDAPVGIEEITDVLDDPPGAIALAVAKLEVRGLVRRRFTGSYEISQGGLKAIGEIA